MKPADIREMTDEELALSERTHRREILDLKLQAQTGQSDNTARIRLAKKDLARLLTEQNSRSARA
ncbi:MAG: 50S ribosomal protein L29 [Verrucomicrobiota bacterium]